MATLDNTWEFYPYIEIQWEHHTFIIRDHIDLNLIQSILSAEEFAELIVHLYRWFPLYTLNYIQGGHFRPIRRI